jgi:hypothetical protein
VLKKLKKDVFLEKISFMVTFEGDVIQDDPMVEYAMDQNGGGGGGI